MSRHFLLPLLVLKHLHDDKLRTSIHKRRWWANDQCLWPRLWLHWDGSGLSLPSRTGLPTIIFNLKKYFSHEIRWPSQADSMTLTTLPYGDIMAKTWTTLRFGKFWNLTNNIDYNIEDQLKLGGEPCMPTRTPRRRHISMTGTKMELSATTQALCQQYPGGKWAM